MFWCFRHFFVPSISFAQTEVYNQFWSEISTARAIKGKWAVEGILEGRRSSKPNEKGMFELRSRFGVQFWGHYFATSRYKLSAQFAYYNNKNVPDLKQAKSTEYRVTPEVIYFFNKVGYTFSTRARIELRFINSEIEGNEKVFRYRQQVNFVYPFNSKVIREGVYYGILSDELYFKSNSDVSGKSFFDRNRFTIGGGYSISDNFQVEVTYINDLLPRNTTTQMYHVMKVTLAFNNLFSELKGYLDSLSHKNTDSAD